MKLSPIQRFLICTFVTLTSGFLGFSLGGQVNLAIRTRACETRPWGLKTLCKAWVTPGALWQGSTTGFLGGTLLGLVVTGMATHQRPAKPKLTETEPTIINGIDFAALRAADLQLTAIQKETLGCLLVLLAAQSYGSTRGVSTTFGLDVPSELTTAEAPIWNQAIAQLQPFSSPRLSPTEAHQLLRQLGFSQRAINRAWQVIHMPPTVHESTTD